MSDSLKEVEKILQKIKESSDSISGGSSEKGSFVMREPNLYWDLGLAVQRFCNEKNIPVNERKGWVVEFFRDKDEAIWPGHQLSQYGYKYVYEFVDKENYLLIADLAGHKFGNFRKKRVDYLLTSFSKRKPQLTPEKQKLLIKRLGERDYSHDEFLKVIQEVRGKTKIPIEKICDRFEEFRNEVQQLMNCSVQERMEFRSTIGLKLLDQIRFTLQLLRMRDPLKFKRAFTPGIKAELIKKQNSKSGIAKGLFSLLKDCLGNEEKTNLLFDVIDPSEMSQLNTILSALKSEESYKEYIAKRQALKEIFND